MNTDTLTPATTGQGVWISLSTLANRKGISRQSAKERVDRLEAKGLVTTRAEGRSRLVDLAAYDRAVGEVGNASREEGERTKRQPDNAAPRLRDAQTERAQYEARLKALDYAERTGNLLPIKGEAGVEQAMIKAAGAIVRALDQIPAWAGDLAMVAKDGQPAMARVLREKRHLLRQAVARALIDLKDDGEVVEKSGGIEIDVAETFL